MIYDGEAGGCGLRAQGKTILLQRLLFGSFARKVVSRMLRRVVDTVRPVSLTGATRYCRHLTDLAVHRSDGLSCLTNHVTNIRKALRPRGLRGTIIIFTTSRTISNKRGGAGNGGDGTSTLRVTANQKPVGGITRHVNTNIVLLSVKLRRSVPRSRNIRSLGIVRKDRF